MGSQERCVAAQNVPELAIEAMIVRSSGLHQQHIVIVGKSASVKAWSPVMKIYDWNCFQSW